MSLVEVVVVLGIGTVLISGSSMLVLEQIRHLDIDQDQQYLVNALLLARARSQITSTEEAPWGVHMHRDAFQVFKGDSYKNRDARLDFPLPRASEESLEDELVFLSGTGNVPTDTPLGLGTVFANGTFGNI